MMFDVLRSPLCTLKAKWAEPPLRKLSEVNDETPFKYAHGEIRTQLVVICDLKRCRLDHESVQHNII